MARLFDDGLSQYAERDQAPVAVAPLAMLCWFRMDAVANSCLLWVGDKDDGVQYWALETNLFAPGDPLRFRARGGGGDATAATTTGIDVNVWYHGAGIEESQNFRRVLLNYGGEGTNADARNPQNADRVSIGRYGDNSPFAYMSGAIAEAVILRIVPTDYQILLHTQGVPASIIWPPQAMVAYWPLVSAEDFEWHRRFDLTAFNSPSIAPHPPKVLEFWNRYRMRAVATQSTIARVSWSIPNVWTSRGAVVAPAPTPAAAPTLAPSCFQSRELTLVVKEPLPVGNALISDSLRVDGLRVIWTANGGFWSLAFNLRGRQSEVEDWIDAGLGRQIELYSPDLILIWGGYASKISGNIGGLSIARGPLIESVANKIQVAFSTVDYLISPPAVGVRDNTDWAEDTASQAKYGEIQRVVSLSGSTQTGAEQVRDTILGEMAEPVSDETDNIGSSAETSVTVECLGWVHWLNAYTYFSTVGGLTTASAKLQLVLGADPNGIFNADYGNIATNTTPTGSWDNKYRQAWSVIKGINSLGDTSFNRYLFGVYADRKAKYNALPTTPKYQRALADPGQWLELFGSGGHINPWDVEPGEWTFYTDLLIGKSQPATLRLDPRYLLIEQAQFSAPWSLSLQGGKSARLDQLLAQMGLGGSGG